jgi:hypothetical protein
VGKNLGGHFFFKRSKGQKCYCPADRHFEHEHLILPRGIFAFKKRWH